MDRFPMSTIFLFVVNLVVLVGAKAEDNRTDPEVSVGSAITVLKKYYEGIHTVQLTCSEKRTATGSGKTETLEEDLLRIKINLADKEYSNQIVESKIKYGNRPTETLFTRNYNLDLLRNVKNEIVIVGKSLPDSKKEKDLGMAISFSSFYQVLPFGIFSCGKRVCHVTEWLENHDTKITRITENECVLVSKGPEGDLEITITDFDHSPCVSSLSFSLSESQRLPGIFSRIKYLATEHRIIDDGFCLPTHFVVEKTVPGDGKFRYDPEQDKYIPLPVMPYTIQSQIVFTDIRLNPFPRNQKLTFETPIPDNTEVHLTDKSQIQHVWIDGRIAPLTDELALARVSGHGFVHGVRESRFWIMGLGLGMILFALAVKIRRYFASK